MNFLFVLIDDLGWKDFGCYGARLAETPNIDKVASEGVRFTNAYAACPVCSPTRASILTGKYPARLQLTDWIPGRKQWPAARLLTPSFRQQLPLEETTLADALKPRGYRSASIGKWHLGEQPFWPDKNGFDLNIGGTNTGSPPAWFGPFPLPGLAAATRADYLTDTLTRQAESFLEQTAPRGPFFTYLPHYSVHLPLGAPAGRVAKYKARLKPGQDERDAAYAAMVESTDASVGRLMAKLDELAIADRTVVFITSDNGGLNFEGSSAWKTTDNAPLRAGKGHLYEGGIRVPLLIRWPAVIRPGSVSDVPVSSQDFFPTVLQMAGARPSAVDGSSLVPLLRSGEAPRRRALYWHYPHYSNQGGVPSGAVRTGDWKLIEFYEDMRLELYNLRDDPGERRNLARREAARAGRMREMLRSWRTSVKAQMPSANPAYDPAKSGQGLRGYEPATPPE